MKIGYIRVSTTEQNTIRQEILMNDLGVDGIYMDKVSGKNTHRPQLKSMLEYVRRGDTVIVSEISRFARNTRDLLDLVETLTAKGVEFVSKKEAIDTTTPTGKFMSARLQNLNASIFCNDRKKVSRRQRSRANIPDASGTNTPTLTASSINGAAVRLPQLRQ